MPKFAARALLALLLALLGVLVATGDPSAERQLVGDEPTYLMQAASLAFDGDLLYTAADLERFVALWGVRPDGLILDSADDGATIRFSKPAAYAMAVAPFVRLAPLRGARWGNLFYLAVAAALVTLVLERRLGPAAALWVATWIFASVAFAYVFWRQADLFLLSVVAAALALAFARWPESDLAPGRLDSPHRWWVVGALLALVVLGKPIYAPLLLPVALAARRERRALARLAAAGAAVILLTFGPAAARGDAWSSYRAERQSFQSPEGFPGVDFPTERWRDIVDSRGSRHWRIASTFEPRQTAWNVAYLLTGRHVGLLPYFLPLLLGVVAMRRDAVSIGLLLAVVTSLAALLWIRPENFYGGGGAIANRYFLPLYPAFWLLAARPRPARIADPATVIWPLLLALAAAPWLLALWRSPAAPFVNERGGYGYVSPAAQRLLPYETTQSHLKPSGSEDVIHGGLWVKSLSPVVRAEAAGERLRLRGSGPAELLYSSKEPVERLELVLDSPHADEAVVRGGQMLEREIDGDRLRVVIAPRQRSRHASWWTETPWRFYELRLVAPGPWARSTLKIRRAPAPSDGAAP